MRFERWLGSAGVGRLRKAHSFFENRESFAGQIRERGLELSEERKGIVRVEEQNKMETRSGVLCTLCAIQRRRAHDESNGVYGPNTKERALHRRRRASSPFIAT